MTSAKTVRRNAGCPGARPHRAFLEIAAVIVSCLSLGAQSRPSGAIPDVPAGKGLFQTTGCLECHSIENRGGSLGPDLSEVGIMRSPESLRLALTEPDAEIRDPYFTVVVVTASGQRFEGIALNEDDLSIEMRLADGNLRSFLKDKLQSVQREDRSLMPSYSSTLSPSELDNLVAYLHTLRGTRPPPGSPVRRARDIAGVSENLAFLNRPDRDAEDLPDALLDDLQIRPSSAVADLGAGAGYFTWRLAQRVGPLGKIIAVDVQPKMLDLVAQEVKKRDLHNVELVLGGEHNPHLPEASVDMVFIAYAYHEFSQPEEIMAAVRSSLKPGGRLVVLEYSLEHTYSPVPGLHKMNFKDIQSEIEPMGFALDRVLDLPPPRHCLIFVKWP